MAACDGGVEQCLFWPKMSQRPTAAFEVAQAVLPNRVQCRDTSKHAALRRINTEDDDDSRSPSFQELQHALIEN